MAVQADDRRSQHNVHFAPEEVAVPPSSATTTTTTPRARDLHVVLDFYKADPQQWCRRSTRGQVETREDKNVQSLNQASLDPYWQCVRRMQQPELFLEGMFLRAVDSDALFPFIHYIVYNNSMNGTSLPGLKPPKAKGQGADQRNNSAPDHALNAPGYEDFIDIIESQGGYRELYTFVERQVPLLPKRSSNPRAAYIVTAFRAAGNWKQLDDSWSAWSGADLVVETLPRRLSLQRVTFHKAKYLRVTSTDNLQDAMQVTTFPYVLLCELGEGQSYMNMALDFVETLKQRQCGVPSLYVVEHYF